MKGNTQKIVRRMKLSLMEGNELEYIENSNWNKVTINDSELLRIVEAADPAHVERRTQGGRQTVYLPGLLVVKIGYATKKYESIMESGGKLVLKHVKSAGKGKRTADGEKQPEDLEVVTDENGRQVTETFCRLVVGSSHGRMKKAIFIREDLYEKVHKVLLGGMDELSERNHYPAYSGGYAKWNAYYGLASTDSKAVKYVPKIAVVRDFERETEDVFDIVSQPGKDAAEWKVNNNVKRSVKIKPFDGAGLVSVECAAKWRDELGLDYIPGAFQIRAIPGIKGNLYTFDIREFAAKNGNKLIDNLGREHDFAEEPVDIILTESQMKFLKMYGGDIDLWRQKFDEPVELGDGRGYRRTFNISEYSEAASGLKGRTRTSYQHLQTIRIDEKECEHFCRRTLEQLEKISVNAEDFLNYRCHKSEMDQDDPEWERIPPYYKAAFCAGEANRKTIFADPYFQEKMKQDIRGAYRRALTGKMSIDGNYQTLVPDIYALARHCFGDGNAEGLLPSEFIYSDWWVAKDAQNSKRYSCGKLALIRNPHIYMEARIASMADGENVGEDRYQQIRTWYRYQQTGIITDSYSTIPLALGTADFDGDTIVTTNCREYIDAVERARANREGNTTILDPEGGEIVPGAEDVCDIQRLMAADLCAFENNIGAVINQVTALWGMPWDSLNREVKEGCGKTVRDYIKIMDMVGQLTIDAVKTGKAVGVPKEIDDYCRAVGKPYFMNYRKKNASLSGIDEEKGRTEGARNNMDRICFLVEDKIREIGHIKQTKWKFSVENFLKLFILGEKPGREDPLYISLKQKLKEMSEQNNGLYHYLRNEEQEDKTPHYRYLYNYAREEILEAGREGEKDAGTDRILDYLLYICYTDAELSAENGAKNILWNCFEEELAERAGRNVISAADFSGIDEEVAKIEADRKKEKALAIKNRTLVIRELDDSSKTYQQIRISRAQIDWIYEKLPGKLVRDRQLRSLYGVLMVIQCYCGRIVMRKGNHSLSSSALAELSGMKSQRKTIRDKLEELQKLDMIMIDDSVRLNPRIRLCGNTKAEGKLLIDTNDYRKACEKVLRLVGKPPKKQ